MRLPGLQSFEKSITLYGRFYISCIQSLLHRIRSLTGAFLEASMDNFYASGFSPQHPPIWNGGATPIPGHNNVGSASYFNAGPHVRGWNQDSLADIQAVAELRSRISALELLLVKSEQEKSESQVIIDCLLRINAKKASARYSRDSMSPKDSADGQHDILTILLQTIAQTLQHIANLTFGSTGAQPGLSTNCNNTGDHGNHNTTLFGDLLGDFEVPPALNPIQDLNPKHTSLLEQDCHLLGQSLVKASPSADGKDFSEGDQAVSLASESDGFSKHPYVVHFDQNDGSQTSNAGPSRVVQVVSR